MATTPTFKSRLFTPLTLRDVKLSKRAVVSTMCQ